MLDDTDELTALDVVIVAQCKKYTIFSILQSMQTDTRSCFFTFMYRQRIQPLSTHFESAELVGTNFSIARYQLGQYRYLCHDFPLDKIASGKS